MTGGVAQVFCGITQHCRRRPDTVFSAAQTETVKRAALEMGTEKIPAVMEIKGIFVCFRPERSAVFRRKIVRLGKRGTQLAAYQAFCSTQTAHFSGKFLCIRS